MLISRVELLVDEVEAGVTNKYIFPFQSSVDVEVGYGNPGVVVRWGGEGVLVAGARRGSDTSLAAGVSTEHYFLPVTEIIYCHTNIFWQ